MRKSGRVPSPPVTFVAEGRIVGFRTDGRPVNRKAPAAFAGPAMFGAVLARLLRDPSFRLARPGKGRLGSP